MNRFDEYYKQFARRYCWVYECSKAKKYYISSALVYNYPERKLILIRQMVARSNQMTVHCNVKAVNYYWKNIKIASDSCLMCDYVRVINFCIIIIIDYMLLEGKNIGLYYSG